MSSDLLQQEGWALGRVGVPPAAFRVSRETFASCDGPSRQMDAPSTPTSVARSARHGRRDAYPTQGPSFVSDHAPTWRVGFAETHLWLADLREAPDDPPALLSAPEAARAARFHFERDRARYIAGRALLRTILGRYLDTPPESLALTVGTHGKPALADPHGALRFNLSHSEDLLLLGLARDREIGVDLEAIRPGLPFQMLADQHFSPTDAAALRLAPLSEKARLFHQLWTVAEAQLKAAGLGLMRGPQAIEPGRWSLLSLQPAPGFAAAVAVEGGGLETSGWIWPR